MEAAGLATGVIALAGLFNNAVDCFEYVQLGRNFGSSFQTSVLKLDDARLRLSRWGESVGLSGDLKDGLALQQTLASAQDVEKARDRLGQILHLFINAQHVSSGFKPGSGANNPDLIGDSIDSLNPAAANLHIKMRELALKRQNNTSLRRKAKWALYEEKHFKKLIEDITDLVTGLTELFPAVQSSQRALCESEVSEMGVNSLPLLKDAVAGQDAYLETAIARILEQHQNRSPMVNFYGNNNLGFEMGVNHGNISGFTFGGKGP
jgi:hypothetical protein